MLHGYHNNSSGCYFATDLLALSLSTSGLDTLVVYSYSYDDDYIEVVYAVAFRLSQVASNSNALGLDNNILIV